MLRRLITGGRTCSRGWRRWPGPPDEAILGAITADYVRFDRMLHSPCRIGDHARWKPPGVLFGKDGEAEHFHLTTPSVHDAFASLPLLVEEYIRLLGMLPMAVKRNDIPIGMEGQRALHSMLISLLLLECGIDRMTTGKQHVAALLDEEQRAILIRVPTLAPTMDSLIEGRVIYGNCSCHGHDD